MQIMHKAEKKYVVGKVSDEEQAKQRQLKSILNKLTPQNFDKLFEQVNEVNIDNVSTLTGVISQIFDKALMEPTFCEMYANFCFHLAGALPDFGEDNEKITFKRLLLNKCQEEFERGEREEAEADKTEEEGEVKQTKEEREEKRVKARRRMLGNIRLIGELYKKRMLTERIMHECIKKLLGNYEKPDEENIEALCKLMSTIGEMIDHPKAKEHIDAYFERMRGLSTSQLISSRVRFLLRDSIDLRKNRWQQRRKVDGPKKIDEVHRDAAQEKHAQSSRLARGPVMNSAPRRGGIDYSSRGSTASLASPGPQQRGGRGFGHQDIRFEQERHHDNRTVPLPQRSVKDETITLGPQGGLARGMSIRGQPPVSNAEPPNVLDHRRMVTSPNGYNSVALTGREDTSSRVPDRISGRIAPATQSAGSSHRPASQDGRSGNKSYSAEDLREKSIAAIREYYR
jgi:translation initiation factor 4G